MARKKRDGARERKSGGGDGCSVWKRSKPQLRDFCWVLFGCGAELHRTINRGYSAMWLTQRCQWAALAVVSHHHHHLIQSLHGPPLDFFFCTYGFSSETKSDPLLCRPHIFLGYCKFHSISVYIISNVDQTILILVQKTCKLNVYFDLIFLCYIIIRKKKNHFKSINGKVVSKFPSLKRIALVRFHRSLVLPFSWLLIRMRCYAQHQSFLYFPPNFEDDKN